MKRPDLYYFETIKVIPQIMLPNRIFLLRDKNIDLTEILLCRATLFECLRHKLLSLRQVSSSVTSQA